MLSFRTAEKNDWEFILKLRNESYKYFKEQKSKIEFEEHAKYMEKQTSNPTFFHWIIINKELDIGYIRILNEDISFMIKKEFQNKGFGTESLKLLLKQDVIPEKLTGRVHAKNSSSVRAFEKAGFELKMLTFEKSSKD
jgi:RimJ/RimL family protein N-acetyltransferase